MLGGLERGCLPPSREGVAPPSPHRLLKSDWDQVDVGKLISDLDEDIRNSEMETREQSPPRLQQGAGRPNHLPSRPPPGFPQDETDKGLKMKIKRTKSGRQEIVKSDVTSGGVVGASVKSPAFNGNFDADGKPGANSVPTVGPPPVSLPVSSMNNGPSLSAMSRPSNSFGGPHMSAGLGSVSGPPSSGPSSFGGSGPASSAGSGGSSGESCPPSSGESGPPSPQVKSEYTAVTEVNGACGASKPPPFSTLSSMGLQQLTTKKLKVDVGTVTDASTLTEPEILGPCEPGTAVNLDGIVWHETDTGVLVVNITWRGKTYVGTLLDCARHTNQWSAPRFTDSPEPGGKGRGKRGRSAATPSEPEPRKNLRSSKGKGKGGKGNKNQAQQPPATSAGQEEEFNFPAPASPAKDPMKRKKEPEQDESKKRKRTSSDSDDSSTSAQEEIRPPPPIKREPKPVVYSYKMLECPRKDCSKQYKHDEGLKWHVSHSHPEFIGPDGSIRDSAEVEKEEQERKRKSRSKEDKEERKKKEAKQENGDRGTPAKQQKLDEKAAQPTTPVTDPKQKPAFPSQPVPAEARSLQVRPPLYTPPNSNGRVPDPVDDLKQKGKACDSPRESPAPGIPAPVQAIEPSLDKEKPPASSPAAYSDISDDGDDSRGKDLKLPQGLSAPPIVTSAPTSSSYSSSPSIIRSSPLPRSEVTHTTTASMTHTQKTCSSFGLPGSGSGPQPGTPEYHKYLAANGFPPFPYPYPVGMDPNYHVQLLKTDPVYKAKWEKDRADRERAFKEQLDKDQGKFSGLSLVKEDRLQANHNRKHDGSKPEDLRKREPSGDNRPRSRASPAVINMISVKPEFREKEDVKREVKAEEGVKPTMETRGPPPGPQTFGYMHPSMIRPPYSLGVMPPPPFDPMMVSAAGLSNLSPYGLPPVGVPSPYLNHAALLSSARPTGPFSFADPLLRSPFPLGAADDMARAAAAGAPQVMSGPKALDLLQQHASQYYANQKLAELQERALKSPISSMSSISSGSLACSPSLPKPITTLAGKDSPTPTTSSKSPPPLRHVHTHTHTHIGLGYPLLSAGALPSVPAGLPPVGSLPPGSLAPPPVGVSSVPFSAASAYPGKSPS